MNKIITLLISSFFIFCMFFNINAQGNYDLYTEEIQKLAPNIPSKAEGVSIDNPSYVKEMNIWATNYPEEYEKCKRVLPAFALFEPMNYNVKDNGMGVLSGNSRPPTHNPPFMRYPVGKQKPIFIGGINIGMDSVCYRNKLQHWYYLNDSLNYIRIYGIYPEIKKFPKPIYHPNDYEEELNEKQKQYFPEFYSEK